MSQQVIWNVLCCEQLIYRCTEANHALHLCTMFDLCVRMCVYVCVCMCMRVHHSFFDLVRSIDWRVVGKGTVGERMRV